MHRLSDTAAAVQEELKKIPELRKRLSNLNLGLFSTDLALVAHGIRTGYLVDVIASKDPPKTFSHLLSALRANAIPGEIFANVLHIYEPTSDQSFFVNTIRLVSRIEMLLSNSGSSNSKADNYPAFVQLHAPFRLLERAPEPLVYLLSSSFMPQPPSILSHAPFHLLPMSQVQVLRVLSPGFLWISTNASLHIIKQGDKKLPTQS
ncbi:hypothetical protein M413DRAFT_398784 [Hebeloma cylindrosporum]|uniref:Uncharacterized protein n=1 Tax=Hebeloma cylindrosporum TaxID=76867 RepID=A0A0C2Y055_HEBCY|nr:hypothetical protein M413DRAFT_398784 [Hebeloma cylindrosporum h7]